MSQHPEPEKPLNRAGLGWLGQLAGLLLGTAGGGLTINILSNDYRWRAVAVALGLAAVAAVAAWLRQYPGTPLIRTGTRLLQVGALGALLLAAVGPTAAVPWATGTAAALTIGTGLLATDLLTAFRFATGTATFGVGITFAVLGVALLIDGPNLANTAFIGFGIAMAVIGVALLIDDATLASTAAIGLGIAAAVCGVALLIDGPTLLGGAAFIGFGIAIVVYGVAALIDGPNLASTAFIGLGVAMPVLGVALLIDGPNLLFGTATFGVGIAAAVYGVARLIGSTTLTSAAVIGFGIAIAVYGIAALIDGPTLLFGTAAIGLGIAVIVFDVSELRGGSAHRRLRRWWTEMTSAPDSPGTAPQSTHKPAAPAQRADEPHAPRTTTSE